LVRVKVLVTGAAGFIGSHLAETLVRRGARVIALDNLSMGSLRNLAWAGANDSLEFVQGDIRDEALVEKLVAGCDWVFHMGAVASVPLSVNEPESTNRQNLGATLHLLELSRQKGVRRFIFASSSSVYGDLPGPASEEMPVNPLTPYALQKYAGEKYGQMFAALHGLETTALRYFNVFGPRQNAASPYSGVVALFCRQALSGESPTVFGDGKQSRDFVYIDNVIAANLLAAESPQAVGQVFNIGMGASVTILDLIAELNHLTGRNLQPEFRSPRPGDIRHSESVITKAESELGYAPRIDRREGLRRTLDFYRSNAT
jgi:UDP-glucose 4-epimerase